MLCHRVDRACSEEIGGDNEATLRGAEGGIEESSLRTYPASCWLHIISTTRRMGQIDVSSADSGEDEAYVGFRKLRPYFDSCSVRNGIWRDLEIRLFIVLSNLGELVQAFCRNLIDRLIIAPHSSGGRLLFRCNPARLAHMDFVHFFHR